MVVFRVTTINIPGYVTCPETISKLSRCVDAVVPVKVLRARRNGPNFDGWFEDKRGVCMYFVLIDEFQQTL